MKNIKLFVIAIALIGCNENKSQQVKRKNMTENKINQVQNQASPPWNNFKDGEVNITHSIEDKSTKQLIESSISNLKKLGFKIPENTLFKNKVLEYFKLDVDLYSTNILALNQDLLPYIALKNQRIILLDDIEPNTLYMLNNLIFYGDKLSEEYILTKNKEIISDLIFVFGYTANLKWLKLVTDDKIDQRDGDQLYLFRLLFGDYNIKGGDKLELRSDMLNKLIESNANLSLLSSVAEDVLERKDYKFIQDRKDLAGYLYSKCLDLKNPQFGVLEELIDNDNTWIDFFKQKDFYHSNNLKNFILNVYKPKNNRLTLSSLDPQNENYGIISDPDGFTNLRKEKNTHSDIIGKIKSGETVDVLNNSSDWYLVKTLDGKKGYVHKSRIKVN